MIKSTTNIAILIKSHKKFDLHQISDFVLTVIMHFALSTMHLTLQSGNRISLFDAIAMISFSSILATVIGSNPAKTCLCHHA